MCALDTGMTRLTAKALMYLVLSPPSDQLPSHTPLRRAAIDLIGAFIWLLLLYVQTDSYCEWTGMSCCHRLTNYLTVKKKYFKIRIDDNEVMSMNLMSASSLLKIVVVVDMRSKKIPVSPDPIPSNLREKNSGPLAKSFFKFQNIRWK